MSTAMVMGMVMDTGMELMVTMRMKIFKNEADSKTLTTILYQVTFHFFPALFQFFQSQKKN